jgi:hypothetical protein
MIAMTETAVRRTEAPKCPAPDSSPTAAGALGLAEEARLRHLFRGLTRAGLVHPLQHLMLRYRAGEGCS